MVKNIDFILWDVLVLQVSFVLGFMIRHGWGQWPYTTWMEGYKSLGIVLSVVDVLVAIAFNTMHNVMKRGYLKRTNGLNQTCCIGSWNDDLIPVLYTSWRYIFQNYDVPDSRILSDPWLHHSPSLEAINPQNQ